MEKQKYKIGDKVEAKITSIAPFGAFADILSGGSGLIHISEIDNKFIKNIADYLPVGSIHTLMITNVLDKPDTYALSLKRINGRKRQVLQKAQKPLSRKEYNKSVLENYPFDELKNSLDGFIDRELKRVEKGGN
ncbi:MAG: S1 RNA-binding domain-containing protein [Firmicutes bacterium]|uniref:S1 RNA-binding domain-containing protein n=1 Tax=Candidatus Scatoplasma merdavium TaxID=2840932 RepID=A0A9D9D8E6_9BACL|nr:S1 RNA-binding domain-containing protein [Candidatus Scatoplasma merdavium]